MENVAHGRPDTAFAGVEEPPQRGSPEVAPQALTEDGRINRLLLLALRPFRRAMPQVKDVRRLRLGRSALRNRLSLRDYGPKGWCPSAKRSTLGDTNDE